MTAIRRDGNESPFSAWVREHPELESGEAKLSVTDSDLWVHRFSERSERKRESTTDIRDVVDCLMLVELKTHARGMTYAQRDTLKVVDALLRMACMVNGRRRAVKIDETRLSNRPKRMVRCFGVHLLQMSGTRPDDSDEMVWNGRSFLQEDHLIELLLFRRDPDQPSKELDTRRHHVLKPRPTLALFKDDDEAA